MSARKRETSRRDEGPARLVVPRDDLTKALQARIELGKTQRSRSESLRDVEELRILKGEYRTWDEYNFELLRRSFTSEEIANEYASGGWTIAGSPFRSPGAEVRDLQREIDHSLRKLSSIVDRLPLMEPDVLNPARRLTATEARAGSSRLVFVVHGHDSAVKEQVAGFVNKLGLEAVVLHAQPNAGRTIIEKFEVHASQTEFAIVLLTGDDEGRARGTELLYRRARQNVVFELGFFYGQLGRGKVVVLYEADVELPSDIAGVLYVPLDAAGAWQMALARELRAAGLAIDLNGVL